MKTYKSVVLRNGVEMPLLIQGTPLLLGFKDIKKKDFKDLLHHSMSLGIRAFDTSHDYGESESFIGYTLREAFRKGIIQREDIFITSKIGNGQQYEGKIETYVDNALKTMRLDYLDLMLLHWPTPGYYLDNWVKLEKVYKSGKVRAIGIANCLERHLTEMEKTGFEIQPHVVQFEYHPFRTVPSLVTYCRERDIQIQAYTSLCQMIPLVTENSLLNELSTKYHCSLPLILLRWVIQQKIAPIFRSYKKSNIEANAGVYHLELESKDMERISALNINYKYHPESLNCPGF